MRTHRCICRQRDRILLPLKRQEPHNVTNGVGDDSCNMYDFCFTPIYSFFLAVAGLYAFFAHGSKASLGGAGGSAAVLGLLAYLSLQHYTKTRSVCKPTVFLSLVIASGLTFLMYKRFERTHSVVSAVIGSVSLIMVLFYAWSLSPLGPKPASTPARKAY